MFPEKSANLVSANGRLILIEGLDLAGKSTLAKKLRDILLENGVKLRYSTNCLVPENPINADAQALRKLKKPGSGIRLLETGSLFLASHLWDVAHFRPPPTGSIHLQESCWLRTVAYHLHNRTAYMQERSLEQDFEFKGDFSDLACKVMVDDCNCKGPEFDLVFYITADVEARQSRLDKRLSEQPKECDFDDSLVFRDPKQFMRLDHVLWDVTRQRFPHAVRIDTSTMTAEEVFELVYQQVTQGLSVGLEKFARLDLTADVPHIEEFPRETISPCNEVSHAK